MVLGFCLAVLFYPYHETPEEAPAPPPTAVTVVESPEAFRTRIISIEATRARVPIDLALAVSRAENATADTAVRGRAGEIGWFQVTPKFWARAFPDECYGPRSLTNPQRNACVGVHILKMHHDVYGDWNQALRAYNGSLQYRGSGDQYVARVMSKMYLTPLLPTSVLADGTSVQR